mmetsp:Transcript_34764/g.66374  ORF Transcript_34764/g.66374 Transcript_34764/m.66374 type:complete len:264 (-) Transcript_34764:307-1098(-)
MDLNVRSAIEFHTSCHNPLISVVTPTITSRHAFHVSLYQCFRQQTYPTTELVVVDETGDPSPVFSRLDDPRIRYIQAAKGMTIGEKRNLGMEIAKGEVIAHFDDDDYYSPEYLDFMWSQMRSKAADLVKLSAWMWYDLVSEKLARFDGLSDGDHTRLYGYGFSYMYRKDSIRAIHGFGAINFGEDYDLVRRAFEAQLVVRHFASPSGRPCVLHILHGGNTSSCFATQQIPASRLSQLFGGDRCVLHLARIRKAMCIAAGLAVG